MAALTKEQISRLIELIRDHTSWLSFRLMGSRYVDQFEINRLKAMGTLPMDVQIDSMEYAFVLGKLEAVLKEAEWKNLSWNELVSKTERGLTDIQELQIESAALSAQGVFRGLEQEIQQGLFRNMANAVQTGVSNATVRGVIGDEIQTAVETRKTYLKVAEEFEEKLKEPKRNWERVAITEMHNARQQGVVAAIVNKEDVYRHSDGEDSDVTIQLDPKACDDCNRIYMDKKTGNPKIFKLSELLANAGTNYIRPWRLNARPVVPPLHPNSIAGYAVVEGNTIAATKMSYTGKIREIVTAQGRTLPVTPNHPIATSRGFIPAGQVQEGDYLLSYNEGIEQANVSRSTFVSGSPVFPPENGQHGPTKIEEVFHTLSLMNKPLSIRRLGSEFHGDAAYGDGDIEIVYADSKLRDSTETTDVDQIQRLLLESAKFSSLAVQHKRLGTSLFMGDGVGLSETISTHTSESSKSFSLPSETLCVGSTSHLDTLLLEMGGQFTTRDASFCGNLVEGLPSLVLQDQVVEIRDVDYSGHVYDLQTVSGVIVSEGLIISNCFCRLRYVPRGWGWNKKRRMTVMDKEEYEKRLKKSVEILRKSNEESEDPPGSHSLLHSSLSSVQIPTKEEIYQIHDKNEADKLVDKLRNLGELHSDDADAYHHIQDLINFALDQSYVLDNGGLAEPEPENVQ